jgi:Spy/CpxP family protein refolding chaperone
MKMKKILGILVAAMVMFASQSYAERGEMDAIHRYMGKLKLSDQQTKDVQQIGFALAKQAIAQRAKIATARVELMQLFKADAPDQSAIEKKIGEISALSVELKTMKVRSWFDVNKLLTPEQQKTWKKALAYLHEGRMHKGMHRPERPDHSDHPMHAPEHQGN